MPENLMPENLTDATSPSTTKTFSLLLDLPIEIQIEIIELLKRYWLQPNPLKSLRLTCKHLEALCNPLFADFISIRRLDRPVLELHKELAPKFAKYLKAMACRIPEHGGEGELFMESVLTTILERTVRLRRITLRHASTDTRPHIQLLNAISKLSILEYVTIWKFDYPQYPPRYDTVESTFHHRLLNHILDYHSQRLRMLVILGSAPMHESTFLKLRDTASQLQRLELSQCLTMDTRDVFADPQRWACAGRLTYLFIGQCAIHSATIARHIGAGVFGPLRRLHIVGCRENSGDSLELATTVWTIPPLKWVRVEEFNDLDMSILKSIHAEKVYMKRVWSGRPLCIEAFRWGTTFPKAVELRVESDWGDKDFEELKRNCATRGLTKVERNLSPIYY